MEEYQLFITQKDNTSLSQIISEAGLELDPEEVWNNEQNLSIRDHSDWPEDATDKENLPLGFGVYIPGLNTHSCIVDKEAKTKSFICRRRLKDLRFTACFYRDYKTEDWKELNSENVQADCSMVVTEFKPSNSAFIHITGGGPLGGLAAGVARLKHEKKVFDENRRKKRPRHCVPSDRLELLVDKEGNQIVDDSIYQTLKKHLSDGKVHLFYPVRGNPSGIQEINNGWVYVYESKGSGFEYSAYQVKAGKYCKAQESNGEYQASPGTKGESFIEISDFFPSDDAESKGPFYAVVSEFALSKKRLDQLKKQDALEARGHRLIQSDVALLNANNKQTDINKSSETLRDAGKMTRHISTHDYQPQTMKKEGETESQVGFAIAFPNVDKETTKRLDAFRQAHYEYLKELNSLEDDTQKKKFLADLLLAYKKSAKEFGHELELYNYVDEKKLLAFKGKEADKYWKREEAAYRLIKWMKSSVFYQWVIDHSTWFEKEEGNISENPDAKDNHESLSEVLAQVFLALAQCQIGMFYLESQRKDRNSIYNQLLQDLANKFSMGILVHNQSDKDEMDLGNQTLDQSPQVGKIDAARKLNGHLINMVYSCYAPIAVHVGAIRAQIAAEEFKKAYLRHVRFDDFGPGVGKVYRFEDCDLDDVLLQKQFKKVQYLEMNEKTAEEFAATKKGKSLFDSVNRLLQIANLCNTLFFASDKSFNKLSKEEKVKYTLNGIGAALDVLTTFEDSFQGIAAGSVLGMGRDHAGALARHVNPGEMISGADATKTALKIGKGFLVLGLASCIIDFCMAADDYLAAVRKGDEILMWSSGFAMTGSALGFVGSLALFSMKAGGAAIFGLFTSPVGWICLAGAFICFLISYGLKLVHKTELEKWLERCVFSKYADSSYPLDNQIKDLFKLLSDFSVEAKSEGLVLILTIKPGILTRDSLVKIENLNVELGHMGVDVTSPNTYSYEIQKHGPKTVKLDVEFALSNQNELLFAPNKNFRDIEVRTDYRRTANNNRDLVEGVVVKITFQKDKDKEWKVPVIRSMGAKVTLKIRNSMFHNIVKRNKTSNVFKEVAIRTSRTNSSNIKVGPEIGNDDQQQASDLKYPTKHVLYINQKYLSTLKIL